MIYQGAKRYPVHEVILHTSATKRGWMAEQSADAKRDEIRRWHMQDRGWRDIGYHYVVDRDGRVATGRPETEIGAHVQGRNRGTIGICIIGGHGGSASDRFEEHYTPAQRQAVWSLIRNIAARTDLIRVTGHNQFAPKACPCFEARDEFPWPPAARPAPRPPLWGRWAAFRDRLRAGA